MRKIIAMFLSFSLLIGVYVLPVLAIENERLEIEVSGMILSTEFFTGDTKIEHIVTEDSEVVEIFDVISGEHLATFELNFANPNFKAQSTGAYRKYLSNGLTLIHSFAFEYTASGTSKIVKTVLWETISVDGWSFFNLSQSRSNAYKSGLGTISGNYSATIKATIDGSLRVTAESKKELLKMGFTGSIEVGSKYYGSKTFVGSWSLSVNKTPGCTTTVCPV